MLYRKKKAFQRATRKEISTSRSSCGVVFCFSSGSHRPGSNSADSSPGAACSEGEYEDLHCKRESLRSRSPTFRLPSPRYSFLQVPRKPQLVLSESQTKVTRPPSLRLKPSPLLVLSSKVKSCLNPETSRSLLPIRYEHLGCYRHPHC